MDDNKQGFTLLEMLVVLAISAILAGIALTYNKASRQEIALSVEAAKISQLILRAESLSIATYGVNTATPVCGYGMYVNIAAQTYGIFEYRPAAAVGSSCRAVPVPINTIDLTTEIQKYTEGTWNIHVAPEVKLNAAADNAVVVLFFPPTPTTYISRDGTNFMPSAGTSKIYLTTLAGD